MSKYFSELFSGAWSLILGLKVTLKAMFTKPVTVHYPRQKIDVTPNFRGHIELIKFEDTGTHHCISCQSCARACPSECITVNGEKREGVKGKVLTEFVLDFSRCSLCSACVEACPTHTLRHCNDYTVRGTSRDDFIFDLKKMVEEQE